MSAHDHFQEKESETPLLEDDRGKDIDLDDDYGDDE